MTPSFSLAIGLLLLVLTSCSTQAPPQTPSETPAQKANRQEASQTAAPETTLNLPPHPDLSDRPEVRQFIRDLVARQGFSESALLRVFKETGTVQKVLDAMAKPYEAKPWPAYRALFLTEKRLQGGQKFLSDQRQALARAEARYGVPPAMITAIIGIESAYGARAGNYRVIDALSTLAFDYPRRAAFFKGELEQFLLLTREEGLDALSPTGSYAGAMGMPQFMPSSYRKLAADGDGDGKRDIWQNPSDAVASVGHYFAKNGWHPGEPLAVPAKVMGTAFQKVVATKSPKPTQSLEALAHLGITPEERVAPHLKGALLELPGTDGPEYWITFHNFNVIMRYNHSVLYAMAATQLVRTWSR